MDHPPMDLPSIHRVDPQLLIPALKSHLPYSLPLLRRLQHSRANPSPTATCLATSDSVSVWPVSGESQPEPWLAAWVDLHAGPETQVVIYSSLEGAISDSRISPDALDRVRAQLLALLAHIQHRLMPEYLQPFNPAPESSRDANSNTNQAGNRNRTTSRTGAGNVIDSRPNPPGRSQPFGPPAFKIGHLHTGLFSMLTASGKYPPIPSSSSQIHGAGAGPVPDPSPQMVVPGLRVHRFDQPPYNKYLFQDEVFVIGTADSDSLDSASAGDHGDVNQNGGLRSGSTTSGPAASVISPGTVSPESNSSSSSPLLPPGYRFSDRKGSSTLLPRHYELICSRSAVFRTPKSLASFPGVVVYVDAPSSSSSAPPDTGVVDKDSEHEEDPIAWAFISADGCLAVLHVEPEHRGKGLAEAASREVMRKGMCEGGKYWTGGEKGWVHADVKPGNKASCKVMEKLGGRVGWAVTFTTVEFD